MRGVIVITMLSIVMVQASSSSHSLHLPFSLVPFSRAPPLSLSAHLDNTPPIEPLLEDAKKVCKGNLVGQNKFRELVCLMESLMRLDIDINVLKDVLKDKIKYTSLSLSLSLSLKII